MIKYAQLKQNRRKFLALTGLTSKEFEALLPAFRRAYERQYPPTRTLAHRRWKRRAGAGRMSSLDSVEQKLQFVLVYQKTYPLQVLLGETFDMVTTLTMSHLSLRAPEGREAILAPRLLRALRALAMTPGREI